MINQEPAIGICGKAEVKREKWQKLTDAGLNPRIYNVMRKASPGLEVESYHCAISLSVVGSSLKFTCQALGVPSTPPLFRNPSNESAY